MSPSLVLMPSRTKLEVLSFWKLGTEKHLCNGRPCRPQDTDFLFPFDEIKIEVGPSAPPMIPMDAAYFLCLCIIDTAAKLQSVSFGQSRLYFVQSLRYIKYAVLVNGMFHGLLPLKIQCVCFISVTGWLKRISFCFVSTDISNRISVFHLLSVYLYPTYWNCLIGVLLLYTAFV